MGLLYTSMKIFHFPDKLASLPREGGETLAPLHVRIKPTNVCNHNCRYCAYRADNLQLGKDMVGTDRMPREKLAEIARDLIDMGVRAVAFSGGGEPLCHPHLADMVRILADSPVSFAALTNGALLKGEMAELFACHGTWVRVSMDGWDDDSYSRFRGAGPGEYTKIMRNMSDFKRLGGKCYLGVSLIVGRENHDRVRESVRRIREAGADSVKISPVIVDNSGRANNEYHRPFFDRVREEVDAALSEAKGTGFEIYDSYHLIGEKFDKDYEYCPYLQILPVIGADLKVYSCQDKAYTREGVLGSIKERSFKEFWFSEREKFFRIDPSRDCSHHCVANAKNRLVLEYLNADKGHLGFV